MPARRTVRKENDRPRGILCQFALNLPINPPRARLVGFPSIDLDELVARRIFMAVPAQA